MLLRRSRRHTALRQILLIIAIPLTLSGTGYALFTQQLSLNTTTSKPAYSNSNNINMSYSTTYGSQGQKTVHNQTIVIHNNNATATTQAWQLQFDAPADFSQLNCAGTVVCSSSGSTITVNNGTGNGTIAAGGGTVTFTLSFLSSSTTYQLQNIVVAGTLTAVYVTMPGLTVTPTAGTRTKQGKWYYWPYSFTVTNNSGNAISAWRIQAPWNSGSNAVSSMDSTVNYVAAATQLTILSTTGMANSSTFQFNSVLGSTSNSWSLTGYTIQGAL